MLTQQEIKKRLYYNPETGIFIKLLSTNHVKAGDICGYINNRGYTHIGIKNKKYLAHRLAWFYMTGEWPKNQIDHINGIKTDNRLCNLREATNNENICNQRTPHKNNKSGYLGVYYASGSRKFAASIRFNNEKIIIGFFDDPYIAHLAYLEAKRKYHKLCTI